MHSKNRNSLGKFQGNASYKMAEAVYNASLDGCCEQLGDVEGFGFYALVEGKRYGFIMNENSQGFVSVDYWPIAEAREKWAAIEKEYEKWSEECESEDF
jgi:hypothetical protein